MSGTLKSKAVNAVVWSAADQFSGQAMRFVIGIVLARLLLPAEFGLLGMLAVFLGVAQVFLNCGLGETLIQKQDATHLDESSVFYVNVLLGLVAAIGLFAAAPWIALFYHQPQLTVLSRIMAVDVLINSFGVVQTMLLTKKMDFKTQLKLGLVSTIVSGIIAIIMAVRGMGVMSLAAQVLIGDTLRTVLLWSVHVWRPSVEFSLSALRRLFSFGSRLFASGMLNAVFQNLYPLIIGKFFAAASLGFYTRASQMQQMPASNLSNVVGRVSFPLFSALQYDVAGLKRAVRKALVSVAFLGFPVMMGLGCVAVPLIRVLITDKWLPSAELIQILCVAGALYPLHVIHLSALMGLGRSDIFFRLEIIKKCLVVLGIVLTYRYGIKAMVAGEAVASIVCYYINALYTVRLISYSWREQLQDLLPYLTISIAMGLVVMGMDLLAIRSPAVLLLLQITVAVITYAAACRLLRLSAFFDTWKLVQERFISFVKPVST
jgi:O-antigen/teichoic acid export membrane protein